MSRHKRRSKKSRGITQIYAASSTWMDRWERYWFAPVAAIRPYLVLKAVLFLLAFDMWFLRVAGGSRYGIDGFNVAHFQWLDAIHPLPSPDLYVGAVLLTGLLALMCAFASANRWLLALLAIIYTYTWAMSMLDEYQHHYFLSLVLTAFIFFPYQRAADLYDTESNPGKPSVSSWGYVLLGVNVGVVYAFTALTKLSESEFLAGQVIKQLTDKESLLLLMQARFADFGVSAELFWKALAISTVAVEFFLGAAYFLAPRSDENRSIWLRVVIWPAFILAFAFHAANELVLSLRIGWFSYYMLALACVYLLPESFLWPLGRVLTWPSRRFDGAMTKLIAALNARSGKLAVAVIISLALAIAAVMIALGFDLDLPGAAMAGLATAALLIFASLICIFLSLDREAIRYALAVGVAGGAMWITLTQSTIRFSYYELLGSYYRSRGNIDAAIVTYEKALRYVPEWKRKSLDLTTVSSTQQ